MDAASVSFGANKTFGLGLLTGELMEQGVTLGVGIPYCLTRRIALSEGTSERLSPPPPVPQRQVLIAKPGTNVPIKVVYESLDAMRPAPSDCPDIDGMIDTIRSQNLWEMVGRFGNVPELVTGEWYPATSKIEQVMRDYRVLGATTSRSGLTIFGLFANLRAT